MDDSIRIEDVKACPTCGHAVVIRGRFTKKFIPVNDKTMDKLTDEFKILKKGTEHE